MNATYLHTVHSPFALPALSDAWCRVVAAYDPDLRIFPSQKRPVYRVARLARYSGPMHDTLFRRAGKKVAPDTAIALAHKLILVNWSLQARVGQDVAPEIVVETLKRRDQYAFGGPLATGDAVADLMTDQDDAEQQAKDAAFKDKTKQISRQARLSVLYRTGQRVSLTPPLRTLTVAPGARAASDTPPATT